MISFLQFISEDVASQERQALNILKRNLIKDPEEVLTDLKSITDPYQAGDNITRPARNQAHLPKLAEFLVKGKIKIETLKSYYDRYIKNPKLNKTPIVKFENFRKFEQFVDENDVSTVSNHEQTKGISEKNAIYSDAEIDVFLGDTKQACILYGQGSKFGLCISRADSSNLFHNYRWEDELTTYFVYFKEPNINDPNFIIVDASKESPATFSYNIIKPNSDKKISKADLIKKFPQLKTAMEKGIFKHKKIEGEEKNYYEKYHGKKILNFTTLDDRVKFIEMGEEISDTEWTKLGDMVPKLLPYYIEIGHDIPKEILNNNPGFKKRYEQKLLQRVLMNIDDDTDLDDYTDDEIEYALKHVDTIKTNLETLAKLEETEIRKHVVNGIYKGDIKIKSKYVLPNLSDIIVTGDFRCSYNNLTSLEGAPKEVGDWFDCSHNNQLISLEYAPKKVGGSFECSYNDQLTSLEGAPKEVVGNFNCSTNNQLTSLEGAPKKVGVEFNCSYNNQLTSLEGAPKEVGGDFRCSYNNQLTSLEGAPKKVGGSFECSYNKQLTSLEGAPKEVVGSFYCSGNKLISLEGAPKEVGGKFDCSGNPVKLDYKTWLAKQ